MPPEESSIPFDIGHVLFIDIVGYSKLLINEQSEQLETLRQIVRATEQFRTAEAEGKLQGLPTGTRLLPGWRRTFSNTARNCNSLPGGSSSNHFAVIRAMLISSGACD